MSHIQRQNALKYLSSVDARDYDALTRLLSRSFTHRFLPASLGGFGSLSRNKQQFLDFIKQMEGIIQSINLQPPQEIFQGQDFVIVHLTNDGKTASGQPYKNEYIFTFRFEGEKIRSVDEFGDSKHMAELLEREGRAVAGG